MRVSLTVMMAFLVLAAAVASGVPPAVATIGATRVGQVHAAKQKTNHRLTKPARCFSAKPRHGHARQVGRRAASARHPVRCTVFPRHKTRLAPAIIPLVPVPSSVTETLAPAGDSSLAFPPAASAKESPGKEPPPSPGQEPPAKEPPGKEPPAKEPPVEPKGPLIGSSAVQPHVDSDTTGSAEAFQYTAGAGGTVNSLSLYVASGSYPPSIVVGLYGDSSGRPGTLLTSATISAPTVNAWNSVDVSPVAVSAGSTYWLAALGPDGEITLRDVEREGEPAQESKSNSLEVLPAAWSSGESYPSSPASFYASETTVTPPPSKPTAAFAYSPTSPVVGQPVTFDATSATCPDGPCTYEWSDDGSPIQPIPPQFPLGSGQTISLTFSSAGTKYVRLLVTNVLGQSATIEHNVAVAPAAPPPNAPSNTALPTVSGPAQVGQTLTAGSGTWSGSTPIGYTYQWQRDGTTNIPGATTASYEPVAADVGHTLDVLVRASNSAGSASATSAPTTAVVKETGGGQQTNCIKVPSACGYPDATNTGVPAGAKLTAQENNISVTTPGTTVKDIALNGAISVEANNTTIEDADITVEGGQAGCNKPCGAHGIWIKPGVTGTHIRDVSCHGAAPTGANVTQYCIMSNDSETMIEHLHAYNCTECLAGPMNVSESFIDETGASIPEEHYEDIYYGGGSGPLIVNHNTMLNPNGQTAVVFASVDFGNQTTLTITNNLMAGGGYVIYGGGSGSEGSVVGPVTITGNRFSRKYYPEGGSYGIASYLNNSVTTWSGNVWDETLQPIPMP